MMFPKELKVGKRKIQVKHNDRILIDGKTCKGSFHTENNIIRLAKKDLFGNTYTKGERSETFWHELTHAILHDMKNDLTYNEKFVIAFSKRLDQAIKTARF